MANASGRATKEEIAHRRRQVAALRLRGQTLEEIARTLPMLRPPLVRPDGKPYSISAVYRDLLWLEKQWRQNAIVDHDNRKAKLSAELLELRRMAWEAGDLDVVHSTIRTEIKLYGLAAPTKLQHSGSKTNPLKVEVSALPVPLSQLNDSELRALRVISSRIFGNGYAAGTEN